MLLPFPFPIIACRTRTSAFSCIEKAAKQSFAYLFSWRSKHAACMYWWKADAVILNVQGTVEATHHDFLDRCDSKWGAECCCLQRLSVYQRAFKKNQMTGLSSAQQNILRIPFWIHATITIHKSQNKVKSLTSGMYMETLTLPRLRTGESLFIRDVTALTSSLCTAMSRRRKRQEQCDVRKYFWLRSAQWSKIKFKKKPLLALSRCVPFEVTEKRTVNKTCNMWDRVSWLTVWERREERKGVRERKSEERGKTVKGKQMVGYLHGHDQWAARVCAEPGHESVREPRNVLYTATESNHKASQ